MIGIEVKLKQCKVYIFEDLYNKIIMNMNNELDKQNIDKLSYTCIQELDLHLQNNLTLEAFCQPVFIWNNSSLYLDQSLVYKTVLYNDKCLLCISNTYLFKFHPSNYPFLGSTKIIRLPYSIETPSEYTTVVKKIVFTDLFYSNVPISVKCGTDNDINWSPVEIKKPGWTDYLSGNTYLEISASENVVFFKDHFSASSRVAIKDLESKINKAMLLINDNRHTDNQNHHNEEECFNKLLQLKFLLDKGVITQEEYIQKKHEWLKQL